MIIKRDIPVSLLLSVYCRETPSNLTECFESIVNQTVNVDELVLVLDGYIGVELLHVIDEYKDKINIKIIPLGKNYGLGYALSVGIQHCKHELIARMDTDDIMVANRLEVQYDFMVNNPTIDVVGGFMLEFNDSINDSRLVDHYEVEHNLILDVMKSRNPFAHMTVMYKKSVILLSGNYHHNFMFFEDYHLWLRVYLGGYRFYNLPVALVYVRVNDMVSRRIGIKYIRNEFNLMKFMLDNKIIGYGVFIKNIVLRTSVRLMPSAIANFIYNRLLRRNQFIKM